MTSSLSAANKVLRHIDGRAACVAAGMLALSTAHAQSCAPEMKDARRAESATHAVAYRLSPAIPGVSRHFDVELVVCPKAGAPVAEMLKLDARMPAHGHGMNYAAKVRALGGGRFQAEGLMFHMPGRWEFVFEITAGKSSGRVTHAIDFQ
jgi:hypothetical protein